MPKIKKITRNCRQCQKEFVCYPISTQTFCCRSCGITARNLTDKNPSYQRDITGDKNPMFGRGLAGDKNPMFGKRKEQAPRWNGGKKTRKDGYVFVVAPDDHPNPAYTKKSGLKYILEHRLVMEQHLGRYLLPSEVVHHKDQNPQNNSIENLQLFNNQSEHVTAFHMDHIKNLQQRRRRARLNQP